MFHLHPSTINGFTGRLPFGGNPLEQLHWEGHFTTTNNNNNRNTATRTSPESPNSYWDKERSMITLTFNPRGYIHTIIFYPVTVRSDQTNQITVKTHLLTPHRYIALNCRFSYFSRQLLSVLSVYSVLWKQRFAEKKITVKKVPLLTQKLGLHVISLWLCRFFLLLLKRTHKTNKQNRP